MVLNILAGKKIFPLEGTARARALIVLQFWDVCSFHNRVKQSGPGSESLSGRVKWEKQERCRPCRAGKAMNRTQVHLITRASWGPKQEAVHGLTLVVKESPAPHCDWTKRARAEVKEEGGGVVLAQEGGWIPETLERLKGKVCCWVRGKRPGKEKPSVWYSRHLRHEFPFTFFVFVDMWS